MKNVLLGELCSYLNGGTPKKSEPEFWNGEFPWITSSEIQEGQILPARSTITKLGIEKSATNLVDAGQLLLVTRTGVGKLAFTSEPLCFSQDITAVVPDQGKLQKEYLAWFLKSQGPYFKQHSRGATIKGITRDALNRLQIPLPPLAKQKRIAGILDAADALRKQRREALAQLDTLLQSTFLDMFGDPVTNPMGWEVHPLSEVTKINPRLMPDSKPKAYEFVSFVSMAAVSVSTCKIEAPVDRPYGEVAKGFTAFRRGDVIVAKITPCFENGKIAYAANLPREHAVGSTEFHVLRPKSNLQGNYLFYFLRRPFIRLEGAMKMRGAVGQKRVPAEFFAQLNIPIPPLDLQQRFARIVESVEQQKARMRTHLEELDTLFASLQSRAFNGEL